MSWDKNDYITALLISSIIGMGLLAALYLLGAFPGQSITTVFPFK